MNAVQRWSFVGIPQPVGALFVLCIDLVTEIAPSTAFAYEGEETSLMQTLPRNVASDRLTSTPLLLYSYVQAGFVLTGGCFLVYFLTFSLYGVSAQDLFSMDNKYFPAQSSTDVYFTTDGSGRSYSVAEQDNILGVVQASWFLMIVCGQASHVWTCRTVVTSLFNHGVFSNMRTNLGVLLSLLIACFLVYTPGLNTVLGGDTPISSLYILYGSLLVTAVIWSFTEGRKYVTRKYPQHCSNRWLAW
jgi:sodium/potassium-transporting ATPase subunit alpha